MNVDFRIINRIVKIKLYQNLATPVALHNKLNYRVQKRQPRSYKYFHSDCKKRLRVDVFFTLSLWLCDRWFLFDFFRAWLCHCDQLGTSCATFSSNLNLPKLINLLVACNNATIPETVASLWIGMSDVRGGNQEWMDSRNLLLNFRHFGYSMMGRVPLNWRDALLSLTGKQKLDLITNF